MPCSAHAIRPHASGTACAASDTAQLDGFDEWRETREDLDAIMAWDEHADQQATTLELPCLGHANRVGYTNRHRRQELPRSATPWPVTTRVRRRYRRQRAGDWWVPILFATIGSIGANIIGWLR